MSSRMGKVVCITGASGYIASWLVKLLLYRGYTIRATVRDTANPKKTLHLQALDGARDRLHLFKASLLEEGTFDAAIAGSDCVFHTTSPFYHNVKDPKVDVCCSNGTLQVDAGFPAAVSIEDDKLSHLEHVS